jgi:predicted GH43/DUF377 family glycosyl hydrolase
MTSDRFLRRTEIDLSPDPTRVVTRFFVPGREEVGPGDSRAGPVIDRLLRLSEEEVERAVADVTERFSGRHQDLQHLLFEHADMVNVRVDTDAPLSKARRLLIGAAFTHEYSIEGAALCNPSAVMLAHDDDGGAAFVMSVRGIGEGHRSSIGFRTGHVSAGGEVTLDAPGPFPILATGIGSHHSKAVFKHRLEELNDDPDNTAFVLDPLPSRFDDGELSSRIDRLRSDPTRAHTEQTIAHLDDIARASYRKTFPVASVLSERVLWPHAAFERGGMEDARFVRFVDERGDVTFFATYTAFDGRDIRIQLLETTDFITFSISPLSGPGAQNKGLALFPRKVGGRYCALSRPDRESNFISFSDDLHHWADEELIQEPEFSWEILQLGNCGSPIETEHGWLVITHGAGVMRSYTVGCVLLDLDDPRKVLAKSPTPFLTSWPDRWGGYVPNVVYSCGSFALCDTLVLPFGTGDQRISVATLSIQALVDTLKPTVR